MRRALVVGGSGMLGHKLWQESRDRLDAYASVRSADLTEPAASVLDPARTVTGVRAEDPATVHRALDATGADLLVNCAGIVKQAEAASDPVVTIRVNSLFPHLLAEICQQRGIRLIHVSTDCVFSGRRGGYTESDPPDAEDLYGRSKLLGEVNGPSCLTLRTSIIGRELASSYGLVEWFLAQRGTEVPGFTRALFSGLTTRELARTIGDVAEQHVNLEGVWHISAHPISKYDLLVLLRTALDLDVEITPDDSVTIDRSLDSNRFRAETGWVAPTWPEMVQGLAADTTPYEAIRRMSLAHR